MEYPEHKCDRMAEALKLSVEGYGLAITGLSKSTDGRHWRGYNGEYDVVVFFCPWCGVDLRRL